MPAQPKQISPSVTVHVDTSQLERAVALAERLDFLLQRALDAARDLRELGIQITQEEQS